MATFLKSFLSVRSIIDICLRPEPALNLVKDVGTKALTTTVRAAAPQRKLRNIIVSNILPCYPEVITGMTIADDSVRSEYCENYGQLGCSGHMGCFDFVLRFYALVFYKF